MYYREWKDRPMTKDEEIAKRLTHVELEIKRMQKDIKDLTAESKKLRTDIQELVGVFKTFLELVEETE
jgi:chaperonin cofactor prefoldin